MADDEALLPPEQHVLSTLERDGSRRWIKPRLSKGRLLAARRVVACVLIALYTTLPWIEIDGEPFVRLDLPARRFTIFGTEFLPTDTLLLVLTAVAGLLGFFLATAIVGRIWCGWGCPQTVYLEFLFRPIERWIEGTTGRGGTPRKPPGAGRVALKYLVFFALSLLLANTFLAYFVGARTVARWMVASPLQHPGSFALVAAMTGAIMVNFSYFREQLCILACPYGRLQSVLLDEDSLIIAYDAQRGEPRGKRKRLPVAAGPRGDCVDCGLCVATCPTGIDIRKGLQMECINCGQCIDACNGVMAKLGRAPHLIRYGSQRSDRGGTRRVLRPRVVVYPLIIAALGVAMALVLAGRGSFDAVLLRNQGEPFTLTDDGEVRNVLRLKLTNRDDEPQQYELSVMQPEGARLELDEVPVVGPGESITLPFAVVLAPRAYVAGGGRLNLVLGVAVGGGDDKEIDGTLLGPSTLGRAGSGGRK